MAKNIPPPHPSQTSVPNLINLYVLYHIYLQIWQKEMNSFWKNMQSAEGRRRSGFFEEPKN
jgi:hypothetical protein